MTSRDTAGWQLILADLALILFLVTVSALASSAEEESDSETRTSSAPDREPTSVAPSQALYRPGPDAPSITEWLDRQSPDPRATLSVVALHQPGGERGAWDAAQELAQQARVAQVRVRIVVQPAAQTDLYASLAFDAPL